MTHTIDEKDRAILDVLREHGEYTTRQISKKIQLPVTTVHHRLHTLRTEGIIRKYTIDLNHAKLEQGFVAHILIFANLALLKQKKKTQHDLAREIHKLPFVERVDIVSGGADLLARIRVRDVHEFNSALLTKLQLIEGIEKTQSLIVLEES